MFLANQDPMNWEQNLADFIDPAQDRDIDVDNDRNHDQVPTDTQERKEFLTALYQLADLRTWASISQDNYEKLMKIIVTLCPICIEKPESIDRIPTK
jgi:hypothetical protein